jgi:D-alanyl-D-alanine carboxypeptidase/D-alanyl-D-alanine carboxypeptidase (penicillin-binding protein 5/6)
VGVKTGFTKKSGRCLVSAAKRDGKFVIAVTLNDPNDWQDHSALLEYGLNSIKQTKYSPKYSNYNIPVINGEKEAISVNVEPITINSLETENIIDTVYLPKFIYAPVKQNEVLGRVVYSQNGKVLAEKQILANSNVKVLKAPKRPAEKIIDNFKMILKNF